MRKLILFAGLLMAGESTHAQYLFGTSVAVGVGRGFVQFNPATNAQKVLVPSFEYYQPVSTKDTLNKVIYFVVQNTSSSFDTLIAVKLGPYAVTKQPIPKSGFGYPQFAAGNIVSISSSKGMSSYNISTQTATITDPLLKLAGVVTTDFDHSGNRYLYCKHGVSSTNGKDTLFVYSMGTKALATFLVDCAGTMTEMRYSPKSNKVVFLGVQTGTGNNGIYSFDLSTQQLTYESPLSNNGIMSDCAAFDEVGNRYFAVLPVGASGTQFNLIEYNLSTKTLTNHNIGSPGIGYAQFFNNAPIPAGIGSAPSADDGLNIFPNPANSALSLSLALRGQSTSLRVTDLTGKIIGEKSAVEGMNTLDISALPTGRYVLSVSYADKTVSRLFEKQ